MSDINGYKEQVKARVSQEEGIKKPADPQPADEEPDLDFVERCYRANEVGDSLLFNRLYRDQFLFNVVSGRWMCYQGPHWEIDHHSKTKAAAEGVVQQYLRLLEQVEEELEGLGDKNKDNASQHAILNFRKKGLLERLNRLRSASGRKSMLECAVSNSDPLTVHTDLLDQQPWLFPCQNGVIDLRTGNFSAGSPSYLLTSAAPTTWTGINTPCLAWESFLREIFDNNQEVIDYLQKVLGYVITGLKSERIFIVFYGPHGQNGKGTLIDVLYRILGKLAEPINSEMLMSQKFGKSASAPSPEVLALKGKRLIWASETEEKNSFAEGKIKLYSGGDPLIGRGISEKEQIVFDPSHVLFLICNDLPRAKAKDSAFWERIKVFNFPLSFVSNPDPAKNYQRPRDKELLEKLTAESSGILAWLVRGCKLWQDSGNLIPPQKIIDDSQDYRNHEDDMQEFIDACCLVDFTDAGNDNRCSAKEIYQAFRTWWEDNNPTRPISQKSFSDQLQLKGFIKIKSDTIFYQFLRLVVTTGV